MLDRNDSVFVAGHRDAGKPDGMPCKLLDSTRMRALGWRPTVALAEGLRLACEAGRPGATRSRRLREAQAAVENPCPGSDQRV